MSTAAGRGGRGLEAWGIVDLRTWWSSNSGIDGCGVFVLLPRREKVGGGLGLYDGGWTEEREKEKGGRVKEVYKEKRMEERER